jgi:ribosomal-protein-alanine N-acetyltransferase
MVKLRDYQESDAKHLVMLANNENVSRYLIYTFPYPYTQKDADWWISTGAKENGAINKVIEYHGEFAGGIGIMPQTGWRSHVAEIGYWLGEPYWGQGIATEALRQMTNHAFEELKFKKLFGPVLEPNHASMRVLEKNDYQLEGVLKQEVVKHDQYFDLFHYARYHS